MVTVTSEVTERRAMEDVTFNIKMLAAYMQISIEALAKAVDINPQHLFDVSSGRVKLTGDDLVKLSNYTGIPAKNIGIPAKNIEV